MNTNLTSSPRYDGTPATYTKLAPASGGAFPFTPPTITGGFSTFTAVQDDLKAPYEYVLNLNYARPLPKHMMIEAGYAGRFAHRAILTLDYGQPLENFVDPKSGQSFTQAAKVLADLYYSRSLDRSGSGEPEFDSPAALCGEHVPGTGGLLHPRQCVGQPVL